MTDSGATYGLRSDLRPGITRLGLRWFVVGLVALAVGFAIKLPCVTVVWDGVQFRTGCYSDIQALYTVRGFDTDAVPYVDELNEYPAGTGATMYAIARATSTGESYTILAFVVLFLWGAVAVACVASMAPRSAWRMAAAPSLVLLGFISWDLIAVGLCGAGLWFGWRSELCRRDGDAGLLDSTGINWLLAGLALGLGAAVKLFPVFLVPALALVPWPWLRGIETRRELREHVVPLIAGFAFGFCIVNVPVFLLSPDGWLETWRFHAERVTDFDSVWYWMSDLVPSINNDSQLIAVADWTQRLGTILAAVGFVVAANVGWRRGVAATYARFVGAFGPLIVFLLLSKVYSPQYGAWLLPLIAVTAVPWIWWVVYELAALGILVSRYRWFLTYEQPGVNGWWTSFGIALALRWVLLAVVCGWLLYRLLGRGTQDAGDAGQGDGGAGGAQACKVGETERVTGSAAAGI